MIILKNYSDLTFEEYKQLKYNKNMKIGEVKLKLSNTY